MTTPQPITDQQDDRQAEAVVALLAAWFASATAIEATMLPAYLEE